MDKLGVIKLVMRNPVQLWPTWEEIEWLIETIEKQQNEYNTLYSSIDEMDVIISQQQEEIKQYKLQEELLLARIKKIEKNSRYLKFMEMAEENLSLATELAMLKGGMSG
jgi:septal ring factor EnvC (AmiA/AmiB activator)